MWLFSRMRRCIPEHVQLLLWLSPFAMWNRTASMNDHLVRRLDPLLTDSLMRLEHYCYSMYPDIQSDRQTENPRVQYSHNTLLYRGRCIFLRAFHTVAIRITDEMVKTRPLPSSCTGYRQVWGQYKSRCTPGNTSCYIQLLPHFCNLSWW